MEQKTSEQKGLLLTDKSTEWKPSISASTLCHRHKMCPWTAVNIFVSKYSDCLYWASEASPTLGCSIKISRDIYRYVGLSMENHTKSTYVKNAWEKLHGPNTRMLKVCFGRLKPNLKQTELQKSKNRGKKGDKTQK